MYCSQGPGISEGWEIVFRQARLTDDENRNKN